MDEIKGTGSAEVGLHVAGNVFLDAASYTISGPMFSISGTIDLRNSTSLSAIIAGLPAGVSLDLRIEGTLSDATHCRGSTYFTVEPETTTDVPVVIRCRDAGDTGTADITGDFDLCPRIDGVSAIPAEVIVGGELLLSAVVHDRDSAPWEVRFEWSAPSGLIDSPEQADTSFTCTEAGAVTISLLVDDGGCTDSVETTIVCSEPPSLDWPGAEEVADVDPVPLFTTNLSGLSYQPAPQGGGAIIWAVQNGGPAKLHKLVFDGTAWIPATDGNWGSGKPLHYPDGTGEPDSEGIARTAPDATAVYVSTERNNKANTVSRLSILRFDLSGSTKELSATNEWNLTADLPAVGANLGLEAIAFVPDSFLTDRGFIDDTTGAPYDPARYPGHGTGIFLVGVEGTGMVHAYALDHVAGGFHRLASLSGGQASIMDLGFDADVGEVWAWCDDTCGNRGAILRIIGGHFRVAAFIAHPAGLPNSNNEGITFAPASECIDGLRAFFWADDSDFGGHSLRQGSIPCERFF